MVGRAPKFLDALKVVSKLLASDQKIERSWMLPMLLNCMSQYHLKFLEYSIKKYDAISSKVTGVIDVTRAPKFLGALKVVPKLVASDQKILRSWMLDSLSNDLNVLQSVAHLLCVPQAQNVCEKTTVTMV